MKSIYENNEKYSQDAGFLCSEVNAALKPIFKKYFDKGYLYREIAHVMLGEVISLESLEILTKAVYKHNKKNKTHLVI